MKLLVLEYFLQLMMNAKKQSKFLDADIPTHQRFQGYAGSVAFSGDEDKVAITSPRGGVLASFNVETRTHDGTLHSNDICGLASATSGFVHSNGAGSIGWLGEAQGTTSHPEYSFDNHVVSV